LGAFEAVAEAGGVAQAGRLAARAVGRLASRSVRSRTPVWPPYVEDFQHIFARNAAVERQRMAVVHSGVAAGLGAGAGTLGRVGYLQDQARNAMPRGVPLNNAGAPRRDFRTGVPQASAPRRDFRTGVPQPSPFYPNTSQPVSFPISLCKINSKKFL